jgi:hypothetical protein
VTRRLIHGHSRLRGQVGEVKLGLVLVELTRRLVVGQRRNQLVLEGPLECLLALETASIGGDRGSPRPLLPVPEHPWKHNPSPLSDPDRVIRSSQSQVNVLDRPASCRSSLERALLTGCSMPEV